MILSHIVAVSENGVIGKNNTLLWNIPEDMQYFIKRTTGKIMIMGRKTYDSFKKPLSNRFHIVISHHSTDSAYENVKYVSWKLNVEKRQWNTQKVIHNCLH